MERCAVCGKGGNPSSIRRCSRCKVVRYCSVTCQSRDWSRHKRTCGESSVDGPVTGNAGASAGASQGASQASSSAQAQPQPPHNPPNAFSSLFDGTLYTSPWERARSRAQEAFPGVAVTDDLTGDLDLTEEEVEVEDRLELLVPAFSPFALPFLPFPMLYRNPVVTHVRGKCGKVLVLQLETLLFLPPNWVWVAKDCRQKQILVVPAVDSPAPYFRYGDLQPGHFLCVKEAEVTVQVQRAVCYILLKDASLVRVFRP